MGAGICGPSRTTPGTIETNEPPLSQKGNVEHHKAGSSKKHVKRDKSKDLPSNEISNQSQPLNGQRSVDDNKQIVKSVEEKGQPIMKDNSRPSSKESNKSRRSGVIQVRPASKEHVKRQSRVNSTDIDPMPDERPHCKPRLSNGAIDSKGVKEQSPVKTKRKMIPGKGDEEESRRASSVDRELGILNYDSAGSDSPFNSENRDGSEMAWSADEESVDIPEGKLLNLFVCHISDRFQIN